MVRMWRGSPRLKQISTGVVIGAALVLAACGDDDDGIAQSSSSDSSTTTISISTTTTTATTAAPTSETTDPSATVEVYFSSGDGSDCGEVEAYPRTVVGAAVPIAAALDQLVAGPTAEEVDAGAGSFFSSDTAAAVKGTSLTDGLLIVDFIDLRPLIPNASTSCGSEGLLAQLDSTVFQFDEVDRVRYLLEGSCDDFGNWLQRDCFEVDRAGRQLDVPTNERASGAGCTPTTGNTLADGRWFGLVDQAEQDEISFDLACWFTGTAAAAAALEDGEESPPPNDYYIRNNRDQVRILPVEPTAEVAWLPEPGDPESVEIVTYQTWVAEQPGRTYQPGVWLVIEDGRVMSIEEQYVP
ncbi:MAG: GerMN domain-containing protein [Actinomycetia bacterium]|nr:GerMN domain-containing protein [Actinomycetes bacterium]